MKKLTIIAHVFAGSIFVFSVTAGPVTAAQELPHPYSPVSVAEAWRAVASQLRTRGLREEQLPHVEDLELPVAVPARAGRTLHVSSACWDRASERARFRIECREAGACLPFLAYLHHDSPDSAPAQHLSPSCQMESRGRSVSSASPHAQDEIRAGQRATAVLSAAGFRVSASVTCLDRGAQGEIIRVRSEEGHVFRARVAAPALVEALPD